MTFYDQTVKHAVYVERYKARLVRSILARLREVSESLYTQVAASDLDRMNRRQLNALLNEIDAAIQSDYLPITTAIDEALREFGPYEANWTGQAMDRFGIVSALRVPSDADIIAAYTSRPFQGKLLRDWVKGLPDGARRRVREAIFQGYIDGVSPLEIARTLRGTRTRKGVMDISARGAEAMARTAVAHVASVARSRTYEANRSIKQVQWLSVLDHRTSAFCRAQDGKVYDKGEGPRPPAHVACRSTVIPFTPSNRDRLESRQTYGEWLAKQPAAVQDDVLGKSRGQLFRDGGYTVDRFVDPSGEEYTLDQLRRKDRETFDNVFAE